MVYLATLERAGLIASKRDSKSILYRIDLDEVGQLIDYLVGHRCRGRPELCLPMPAGALQLPFPSSARIASAMMNGRDWRRR